MTSSITQIKIVLLGDESVGKTSLMQKWISGSFNENSSPTVGGATQSKIDFVEGNKYSFQLWDTAGAERYRALTPLYTRDAAAAMLVFDLTKKSSVDSINSWFDFINQHGKIPFILVGNKDDLSDKHVISSEDATEIAFSVGSQFFSTSAKTGSNVDLAFKQLEITAIENFIKSGSGGTERIVIDDAQVGKSGGCC